VQCSRWTGACSALLRMIWIHFNIELCASVCKNGQSTHRTTEMIQFSVIVMA